MAKVGGNGHRELCVEKTYRVNLVSAFAQVPPGVLSVAGVSTLASDAISETWLIVSSRRKGRVIRSNDEE